MTPPSKGPSAHTVAAIVLLTSITLAFMWPVLRRPGGSIYIGGSLTDRSLTDLLANDPTATPATTPDGWGLFGLGDTLRSVYTLAWWTHALSGGAGSRSPYDANALYPTPRSLTYADLQLGVVPAFAPAYLTAGNPVLAYNLALLAGLLGCALGFFALLRSWTGSTTAGIVAGVASIVAPFRVASVSLVYLHFIPYIPIALLCVDAVIARRRPFLASVGLLACLALQASSSGYLTYVCFLLVPLYCLGALLESRRSARMRAIPLLLTAGLAALGLLALLYRPFVEHAVAGSYGEATGGGDGPAHNPWMILLWTVPGANIRQHFLGNCGLPVVVLAGMGLLYVTARRRWTILGTVVAGAVLVLGASVQVGGVTVSHLPWEWLGRLVPGFTVQRQTYLTSTLVGVGVVCLAGLGTAWLVERTRRRGAWIVVAVALAVSAAFSYDWRLAPTRIVSVATDERVPPAYRWLAAHGDGGPLLELPNRLTVNPIYAYFSTYHWLPIFNGSFSYAPSGYVALGDAAARVLSSEQDADAFLRKVPVRWVLVHGDLLAPTQLAELSVAPPHLTEVARFDRHVILYRTRVALDGAGGDDRPRP